MNISGRFGGIVKTITVRFISILDRIALRPTNQPHAEKCHYYSKNIEKIDHGALMIQVHKNEHHESRFESSDTKTDGCIYSIKSVPHQNQATQLKRPLP